MGFALPTPLPFFYGWDVHPNSIGVPPAGLTSAGGNLSSERGYHGKTDSVKDDFYNIGLSV